jgi:hypothetical protein
VLTSTDAPCKGADADSTLVPKLQMPKAQQRWGGFE